MKELVGYRKSLVDERAREVNRIQKALEGADIKLASVATDITGVSGRSILDAIVSIIAFWELVIFIADAQVRRERRVRLKWRLHRLVFS